VNKFKYKRKNGNKKVLKKRRKKLRIIKIESLLKKNINYLLNLSWKIKKGKEISKERKKN